MKLWIKYLIGIALGLVCALVLPLDSPGVLSALSFITEIIIRFGRYAVVPLVFFTTLIAVNKLREDHMLFSTGSWTAIVIAASSLLLALIGVISILIVKLPRIPITVEKTTDTAPVLSIGEMIRQMFPYSAFSTLTNGSFILAPFLLACFAGGACPGDKIAFKPIVTLTDSLSKLCYNIATLFTEVLSIGMIAVMCSWTIEFRNVITGGVFLPLFLLLLGDLLFVAFVVYPVIIHYVCHDPHPYRVLYASLCSVLTAFFSGDTYLTLPLNIRHGKESLGIKRRINGTVYPVFSIFARGGAGLVAAVGFIVIWRSYSNLTLHLSDVLWILTMSFGLSFLLGGFPSGGAFIALTVLCIKYSRGFDAGYLLLKPASVILCSFAAAFDALTALFGSYIVAVKTKMIEHHNIQHYI